MFTLTMNERFAADGGYIGKTLGWILTTVGIIEQSITFQYGRVGMDVCGSMNLCLSFGKLWAGRSYQPLRSHH